MRRREFIAGLGGAAAWPLVARAQQRTVPVFLAVMCIVLLINGLLEISFAHQQHKVSLIRSQREQAEAAAAKIGQFIKEMIRQGCAGPSHSLDRTRKPGAENFSICSGTD